MSLLTYEEEIIVNNYPNVGAGLKKMFIAQIGIIVCTVLAIIPIINIIAGIGAIVFAVISIVGLYGAGKDIEGCKKAFIITIVNIVISIFASAASGSTFFSTLFSIAGDICAFLIVYNVCTSVSAVLKDNGNAEIAAKGESVWKINFGCYVASIVISILAVIPFIKIFAGIAGFILAIVSLVAGILYMIFLNKSYQAFGA